MYDQTEKKNNTELFNKNAIIKNYAIIVKRNASQRMLPSELFSIKAVTFDQKMDFKEHF